MFLFLFRTNSFCTHFSRVLPNRRDLTRGDKCEERPHGKIVLDESLTIFNVFRQSMSIFFDVIYDFLFHLSSYFSFLRI